MKYLALVLALVSSPLLAEDLHDQLDANTRADQLERERQDREILDQQLEDDRVLRKIQDDDRLRRQLDDERYRRQQWDRDHYYYYNR